MADSAHPKALRSVLRGTWYGVRSGLDFWSERVHGSKLHDAPSVPSPAPGRPGPQQEKPGGAVVSSDDKSAPAGDESPRVPGFRTWRGVYLFVFGAFLVLVVLLALFSRAFA